MKEIPFLATSCLCSFHSFLIAHGTDSKEETRIKRKKEREIRTSQAVSITSSPLPADEFIVERQIHLCKYFWATRVQIQWRRRDMASPSTGQKYRLFQSEALSNFFQVIMVKKDPLRHLITKRELKDGSAQPLFKHKSRLVEKCHQITKLVSLSMPSLSCLCFDLPSDISSACQERFHT